MKNYYSILGIDWTAGEPEIKLAYRKLALKWHPDKNGSLGSDRKFREIKEAYDVLSNPEKRRAYDLYYLKHYYVKPNKQFNHTIKLNNEEFYRVPKPEHVEPRPEREEAFKGHSSTTEQSNNNSYHGKRKLEDVLMEGMAPMIIGIIVVILILIALKDEINLGSLILAGWFVYGIFRVFKKNEVKPNETA